MAKYSFGTTISPNSSLMVAGGAYQTCWALFNSSFHLIQGIFNVGGPTDGFEM